MPDPIQRSKDRLLAIRDGTDEFAPPAQAEEALAGALLNKEGGFGGRSLGFGVIDSQQAGDGVNFRVLVTDGTQEGVIVARLSRTLLAVLARRNEDPEQHLIERLQNAAGSLPNDGNRWLNIVLQDEPLGFNA